jgi:RNA polymerase sigma-70 factor, ECF subfamily
MMRVGNTKTMDLFHLPQLKNQVSLEQPAEFSRFYQQAHLDVFRYVMVLCAGNQPEAEDITAEAFFRAWEKRQQFSGSSRAALSWVITIARNLLIDQRRSAAVHPLEPMADEALPDTGSSIESLLVGEEQVQLVLDAIQTLPFPHRDIVTLRYVLGWRVNAIAAHLGLAENTVSVDLRRALVRLQNQLVPQDSDAGRTA